MTDRILVVSPYPPVRDGMPLYWDKFHISSSMAKSVALPLELSAAAARSSPGA